MLQRFSQYREHSKEIFWIRVPGPSRLTAKGPPTRIHGFANSVPRVRCDDHTSEARDAEMKGLSSTLQPPTDQPGRDRTAIPWPVGCAEPSHQSVNNPLTRVSVTLSRTLSETLQLQVRHNVRELDHASPPATTAGEEHRNDTLLRGLLTLC